MELFSPARRFARPDFAVECNLDIYVSRMGLAWDMLRHQMTRSTAVAFAARRRAYAVAYEAYEKAKSMPSGPERNKLLYRFSKSRHEAARKINSWLALKLPGRGVEIPTN